MSDSPRTAATAGHGITVLLVDDQAIIGEAVRRMLLSQKDINFHFCQDPNLALSRAAELAPTVILQDLVMPGVDGLDLVRAYRDQDATRLTPLIVLSSKEEAATKAEAFARGANDYLVKLPDPIELIARIRYHSRGYVALLERNEAYSALAASERALLDELAAAAEYVRSLLPKPVDGPIATDWRFIPSASLGGDAFEYQWLDDDHLAVYLLDVSGHGVGPALLSISVLNMLRSRSLRDADFRNPGDVLRGLNESFQMSQHSRFFTMWYGVYRPSTRELVFSGAGHPPALLLSPDGSMQQLDSQGLMVGVMTGAEYDNVTTHVAPNSRLLLYSDGAFEVQGADQVMWTFEEFLEHIGKPVGPGESRIDRLLNLVRSMRGDRGFEDDLSVLELRIP